MTEPIRTLSEAQAAELLNVSLPTLRRWRRKNKGPVYERLGGRVRYAPADLESFRAAKTHGERGAA